MNRYRLVIGALAALVAVVVVGGFAFWYFIWRDDAPPAVSLASAVNSLSVPSPSPGQGAPESSQAAPSDRGDRGPSGTGTRPAGGGDEAGGGDFGVKPAPNVAAPALPQSGGSAASSGVAGTWSVDAAQQSFVGYRVDEQLRAIGSNTVVGRTPGVTGQAVISESSVTSAKFVADVTKLKSDNSLRDGQLRNQGIQFSTFPTSTFELSQPVSLPSGLAAGQPVNVTLQGKFTLHGVTKEVSVPVQAQVVNNNLVVVGSFPVTFADYQVSKPRGGPVLSLADGAIVELQLILARS